MAESSSKENDGEDTDRMSSLPDFVLCHILSFLPTITCVATMSLVSRRWRHLWEHLQVFDFCEDYDKPAVTEFERFQGFSVFVNAVLALRRSRDNRKMRLSCSHPQVDPFTEHYFIGHSVDTWLRTAIGPHLEELHLALFSTDEYTFHLPLTLFTCTNLVSFSLCGNKISVQLQRSSAIRLPSLKTLQLDMGDVDVNSVDVLLSGCPILETLELSLSPESLTRLCVPPSLKRLKFGSGFTAVRESGSLKFTVENRVGVYLDIDAPGLKYLSLSRITLGAVGNLHSVVEACLGVFSTGESESADPLLNLLRALSETKHLTLRRSTTKWLFVSGPDIDFPEFHHLRHLELMLPIFNSCFLFDVLEKCPMLQALIIQNDKDQSSPVCGPQPESVPNCLVSHLTFIHFKGYQGYLHELKFAGYVLRNGLVLKTMVITGLSLDRKEKWEKYSILKNFSDIPRGSAICQLKFY